MNSSKDEAILLFKFNNKTFIFKMLNQYYKWLLYFPVISIFIVFKE